MITQSTNVNLIPKQISPRVHVSQYDKKSRILSFALYNGSQPFNIASGMAVTIEGTKADNTGFQYAMTSTVGSNVVSMSIEQQMTVLAGEVPCEIVVTSTGKKLCSANFILVVEPAALSEDTIISETELPLIEEAAELAENIAIYITIINEDMLKAEGYAVGKQNGTDVGSGSPYYHNNAKYYKEQAASSASTASTKASEASTSATNAASSASTASTKASQASTSATNAATSATNAANSASTASTKASEASTSASTASTKASEAAASAQAAQQAAASLTVDSATSTTSTHPVQNKVITGAVNLLKETFANQSFVNGAANMLPNDIISQTITTGGANVTVQKNADGTMLMDGTVGTSAITLSIHRFAAGELNGRYRLTGIPSNGSSSTYSFWVGVRNADNTEYIESAFSYGKNYIEFDVPSNAGWVQVSFELKKNYTASSLTIKPMLTLADMPNSDYAHYVPYAKSNKELTENMKNPALLYGKSEYFNNAGETFTFSVTDDNQFVLLFVCPWPYPEKAGMYIVALTTGAGSITTIKAAEDATVSINKRTLTVTTGKMYTTVNAMILSRG